MAESKISAKKGGQLAKNARLELEEQIGHKIVSDKSFLAKKIRDSVPSYPLCKLEKA
jgi:hypothetical protein